MASWPPLFEAPILTCFAGGAPAEEEAGYKKRGTNRRAMQQVIKLPLRFQIKFRKIVDVRREKELEAKRKHEKMIIGEDHPVRKLLARIRERHHRVSPQSLPEPDHVRRSWKICRPEVLMSILTGSKRQGSNLHEETGRQVRRSASGPETSCRRKTKEVKVLQGLDRDRGGGFVEWKSLQTLDEFGYRASQLSRRRRRIRLSCCVLWHESGGLETLYHGLVADAWRIQKLYGERGQQAAPNRRPID